MNKKQAIGLFDSGFWKELTDDQIVAFQLYEPRLCMPFDVFHEAVEKVLDRPVWTHEFAFSDLLKQEYEGKGLPPTMEEILDLIPEEKRIIIVAEDK